MFMAYNQFKIISYGNFGLLRIERIYIASGKFIRNWSNFEQLRGKIKASLFEDPS